MKAKTLAAFFVALLVLASQFSLRAQSCYGYQCPQKIFAPCEGVYGARVSYTVTASNLCNPSLPPTVTYSVPPGSLFPPGTNIVCATIQIPGLPPQQCCFPVIVDNCCPTNCIDVICPSNVVVGCQQTGGSPGAFVVLPQPTPTNYCGDHTIPANYQIRCMPQSQPGQPVFFPPGTNNVVCCISDNQGFLRCCCFNVLVTNCPPQTGSCQPLLACPTDISISCQSPSGAVVFFPPAKITNPCNVPILSSSCTHVSGSVFPNGKTTVACCITYQDPLTGLVTTECCCFDVVVRCCQPTNCVSTLTCPNDMTIDCPPAAGTVLTYIATGNNNCGEPITVICDPPSGSTIFGPTNVCCRLLNSGVVVTQCCFHVLVLDTTPPDIHCPGDITVISTNCQPVPVAIPVVTASDNCDPNPTVSCTPIPNAFPCGTTTINCTAVDSNGNSNRCAFNVTVICNNNPQITCPPDIFVSCASPTGVVVTFTVTVTNSCSPTAPSVTCSPASGSIFLPGTTTVCCSAGATGPGCCFKVTVTPDDVPPQIQCPTNVVVISPNCTTIDVSYPAPTATDNCQLDYVRCTPPSNSPFPVGVSTVLCCAVDKAGNSNCCNFTVTVRCPTNCIRVVCPTNVVVDCAGPNGATVTYTAYAIDTCTGNTLPLTCSWPSGSVFPIGATIVCCTNTVAGSVPQWCCFDVTVRTDTQPPTITCPSNIVVTSPNCVPISVPYPAPTASDDCQLDSVICNPPVTFAFPVGVTTVTCCAVDKSGNSNCCNFTVTVRCPSNCVQVVCPTNLVVDCAGPNGAVVTYTAYAIDNCTGNTLPLTCSRPSGSVFPIGATVVCCTNTTAGATPVWCCFDVTVRTDTQPPTITCPSNIVVTSPNCVPINVPYPAPTATDNCQLDSVTCNPPATFNFPIGITTVTCCAVDKSGNSNCCNFTITVRCPTNCVQVVCPTNLVINCAGPNGAVVTYTAYAIDNCTGNIMPVTCTRPSGSVFPIGVTVVCCTNTAVAAAPVWCCFDVTVRRDTQPPSITCPSNIVVTSPNCVPISVPYPAPTASDDCQLDSVTCNPPVTFAFPVGVTTVTCCAVDKSGNSNCCTFTITVRCPTNCVQVICPTNVIVDCAGPNGAVVTYTAYAIDNCTGNLLPVTCSRPSGTFFPIGATVVCCTNTVAGAAPVWCCFDVTVKRDTLPPVINCPSNIYQLCVKPNGTKITYNVTATDNCDTSVSVTCVPPSGSLFLPGCSNVVCTATDHAGNTSTCTFRVCLLSQGCYVRNPSFELLLPPPLPAAAACGDPIALALGWSALSGTPDLFRPPFASIVPGNCRGQERPCDGTNYAGLEGGYTSSGGFTTEEMMGTLIFPLNNGDMFRLRACLSLAETSPGPVLLEFALANSANLAQQVVIHQVMVTQTNGWLQYLPPCFRVPQTGNWDRLIIRAAQVPTGQHTYKVGYVYVDNVNICCCKPKLISVVLDPNVTTVTWDGTGQLQGSGDLSDPTGWHNIDTPVEIDPDTGDYRTRVPRSPGNLFFRVVGPDNTAECSECGAGG